MTVITEIRKAFDKSSVGYEQSAKIQMEIGERLFERLSLLKINPRTILDLGCGPGVFSERLKRRYPDAIVVGVDLAFKMLKCVEDRQGLAWPLVQGDMCSMPFATGSFDLVFANQVVHWSKSLTEVMRELNRVMTVSGCLMFSTLGPDTFDELRTAWAGVDEFAHVNDFIDMHDIGDCLMTEYFQDPVVDREILTAHYSSLRKLLEGLKTQGVRNINPARLRGLTGRQAWIRFEQAMLSLCGSEGRLPLTYEVIYGHAWKGEQRRLEAGVEVSIAVSTLSK